MLSFDMELVNLRKNLSLLRSKKELIVEKWVQLESVKNNLSKLKISEDEFKKRYAIVIYEYFLSVIEGKEKLGNCPAMNNFVSLMVERDIRSRDAFMICLGLKTVLSHIISKSIKDNTTQTLMEMYKLLDANFSGVLELFTQLYLNVKQSLEVYKLESSYTEQMQVTFDMQDDFVLLLDDELNVKLCNKSFLNAYALKDVNELNEKYPNLSFIEYIQMSTKHFVYEKETILEVLKKVKNSSHVKISLNYLAFIFMLKVSPMKNSNNFLMSLSDVTEYEQAIKSLRSRVYVDPLTNLYNGIKFDEEIKRFLRLKPEYFEAFAIVTLVIDDFNYYIYNYDQPIIEDLITKTAKFLHDKLRYVEILARTGEGKFNFITYVMNREELNDMIHELMHEFQNLKLYINEIPTFSTSIVFMHEGDCIKSIHSRSNILLKKIQDLSGNDVLDDKDEFNRELINIKKNQAIINDLKEYDKAKAVKAAFIFRGLVVFINLFPLQVTTKGYKFNVKNDDKILSKTIYLKLLKYENALESEVTQYNKKTNELTLNYFKEVTKSPFNQHFISVAPKGRVDIELEKDKTSIDGFISSFSQEMIKVFTKEIGKIKKEDFVTCRFKLLVNNKIQYIEFNSEVKSIDKQKDYYTIGLTLDLDLGKNHPLIKYIYARQLEIIREYNSYL